MIDLLAKYIHRAGTWIDNMKPKRGHILIFSDHRGIRRFFLRVHGTADELQPVDGTTDASVKNGGLGMHYLGRLLSIGNVIKMRRSLAAVG